MNRVILTHIPREYMYRNNVRECEFKNEIDNQRINFSSMAPSFNFQHYAYVHASVILRIS